MPTYEIIHCKYFFFFGLYIYFALLQNPCVQHGNDFLAKFKIGSRFVLNELFSDGLFVYYT